MIQPVGLDVLADRDALGPDVERPSDVLTRDRCAVDRDRDHPYRRADAFGVSAPPGHWVRSTSRCSRCRAARMPRGFAHGFFGFVHDGGGFVVVVVTGALVVVVGIGCFAAVGGAGVAGGVGNPESTPGRHRRPGAVHDLFGSSTAVGVLDSARCRSARPASTHGGHTRRRVGGRTGLGGVGGEAVHGRCCRRATRPGRRRSRSRPAGISPSWRDRASARCHVIVSVRVATCTRMRVPSGDSEGHSTPDRSTARPRACARHHGRGRPRRRCRASRVQNVWPSSVNVTPQ